MPHAADKEEIEMLKTFWRDYGKTILIAIIIGLGIGYGYRYWSQNREKSKEEASNLYAQVQNAVMVKDAKTVSALTTILQQKHASSIYAIFSSFLESKVMADGKRFQGAITPLKWIIKQGGYQQFVDYALIKEAALYAELKKPDQSLGQLKKIDNGVFHPLALSVKGDILMQTGKKQEANSSYASALQAFTKVGLQDPLLSMQLNQSSL